MNQIKRFSESHPVTEAARQFVVLLGVLLFFVLSGIANGFASLDQRLAQGKTSTENSQQNASRMAQANRSAWLGERAVEVSAILKKAEIRHAAVYNRVKSLESASEKVRRRGLDDVEQLNDLYGMRIVVENELDVYRCLNVVCSQYEVIPGTLKNYIVSPKPSGYQSIHVVNNIDGRRVEFQIRTTTMHEQAEAEHEAYKKRVCIA